MVGMLSIVCFFTFLITYTSGIEQAPFLSYFRDKIRALSNNSLTVNHSKALGYHLYTTKDIDNGQPVLELPCSKIIGVYDAFKHKETLVRLYEDSIDERDDKYLKSVVLLTLRLMMIRMGIEIAADKNYLDYLESIKP
jgi:hypothetical protein